jgi:hypothetical protein
VAHLRFTAHFPIALVFWPFSGTRQGGAGGCGARRHVSSRDRPLSLCSTLFPLIIWCVRHVIPPYIAPDFRPPFGQICLYKALLVQPSALDLRPPARATSFRDRVRSRSHLLRSSLPAFLQLLLFSAVLVDLARLTPSTFLHTCLLPSRPFFPRSPSSSSSSHFNLMRNLPTTTDRVVRVANRTFIVGLKKVGPLTVRRSFVVLKVTCTCQLSIYCSPAHTFLFNAKPSSAAHEKAPVRVLVHATAARFMYLFSFDLHFLCPFRFSNPAPNNP